MRREGGPAARKCASGEGKPDPRFIKRIRELVALQGSLRASGFDRIVRDNGSELEKTPFGLRYLQQRVRRPEDSLRNQCLTIEIPNFDGNDIDDDFLDWVHAVERVFDLREIPDNMKVKLVAMKFKRNASLWWKHTKSCRRKEGKSKVKTWEKMKKLLLRKFLPINYQQEHPSCYFQQSVAIVGDDEEEEGEENEHPSCYFLPPHVDESNCSEWKPKFDDGENLDEEDALDRNILEELCPCSSGCHYDSPPMFDTYGDKEDDIGKDGSSQYTDGPHQSSSSQAISYDSFHEPDEEALGRTNNKLLVEDSDEPQVRDLECGEVTLPSYDTQVIEVVHEDSYVNHSPAHQDEISQPEKEFLLLNTSVSKSSKEPPEELQVQIANNDLDSSQIQEPDVGEVTNVETKEHINLSGVPYLIYVKDNEHASEAINHISEHVILVHKSFDDEVEITVESTTSHQSHNNGLTSLNEVSERIYNENEGDRIDWMNKTTGVIASLSNSLQKQTPFNRSKLEKYVITKYVEKQLKSPQRPEVIVFDPSGSYNVWSKLQSFPFDPGGPNSL